VHRRTERQEQIQIIATAIGNPMAKAPPIAKANAKSKLGSGCVLTNDMRGLHDYKPKAVTE
jgi:hypothetical protein